MTCACSSRTPAAGVRVPPEADKPTPPAGTTVAAPELPPASPAEAPSRPVADIDDCTLIAAPGEPISTVALSDDINPTNAPRPSNESERLLFRQLYETLVRVDCMGRVRSGLAASWRIDGDAHTWIVTLRENPHFSDGTPVTAADVHASWTRDSGGGELRAHVNRLVESVVTVDERTLAIRLRSHRADTPMALAHPDLAVAKSIAGSSWPLGTRSARIARDANTPPLVGKSVMTLTQDDLPAIRFLVAPGDPRDLLDDGVDLLLTRDPATLEYAATLPHLQLVPLAWQRTYVLLTPGRSRSSPSLTEEARQALANDAVRGEARGAQGPFWWETLPDCEVPLPSSQNQSAPTPRVVYEGNDAAARDLAERFVGLVRASSPAATAVLDVLLPDRPRRTFQRATGLTGEALARARRLATDAGYIVPVDSRPLDPCGDLHAMLDSARWLDPETIVPLVETRLQAIVRRGRAGVRAEWDGGLVIAGWHGRR
jgi:Bacterial extracellular solute-binding proteins, family 5 Middle